jgi:CO/xanthine dehydrogenase FAD-binding subunit
VISIRPVEGLPEIGEGDDLAELIAERAELEDGDVLTAIRLPAEWSGARFYFEKVADRNTWDFPLVNVAAAIKPNGTTIGESRLVVNAVAAMMRSCGPTAVPFAASSAESRAWTRAATASKEMTGSRANRPSTKGSRLRRCAGLEAR